MIIGLAGKSGSGKNRAAEYLETKGFLCFDLDKVGHQVLEEKREELIQAFGSRIRSEEGTIDRKVLGEIVFSSSEALSTLENITHPVLFDRARRFINQNKNCDLIINAALLHRDLSLVSRCDAVFWVQAPLFIRFRRLKKRDKSGTIQLMKRFFTQRELKSKHFFPHVDTYTIGNGGSVESLIKKLDRCLIRLRKGRD